MQFKPYAVRYEAVNAMLLNEFLKEHHTVQELKSTAAKQEATIAQLTCTVTQQQKDFQSAIAKQQTKVEALTARLVEQASQIQKVTRLRRVASDKPAPQVVVNDR